MWHAYKNNCLLTIYSGKKEGEWEGISLRKKGITFDCIWCWWYSIQAQTKVYAKQSERRASYKCIKCYSVIWRNNRSPAKTKAEVLKYLEAAEINKSILEITEQKQLKVKELENLNKAEMRSKKTKKKKAGKERSSNLPSSIKGWSTKESSSNSGDETEIIPTDESENELQVPSQAERQTRKEMLYSYCAEVIEQNEPTCTQVQPPAKEAAEESPEMTFF